MYHSDDNIIQTIRCQIEIHYHALIASASFWPSAVSNFTYHPVGEIFYLQPNVTVKLSIIRSGPFTIVVTSMILVNVILRTPMMMMIQRWMIFSQQNHISVRMIMTMPTNSLMNTNKVKDNKVQQHRSYKSSWIIWSKVTECLSNCTMISNICSMSISAVITLTNLPNLRVVNHLSKRMNQHTMLLIYALNIGTLC